MRQEYPDDSVRIYYQFDVNRLSACPLTIHALLHVADDIEMNGPSCNNWSFVMERYCGVLVPAVKSRKYPFTALSLRQLHITRLNDIKNRYNLHEALQDLPPGDGPSSHELVHRESDCMLGPAGYSERWYHENFSPSSM
jgi:hypothetical protein